MKSPLYKWTGLVIVGIGLCLFSCAQESVKESGTDQPGSSPVEAPPSEPALAPGEMKEESLSMPAEPSPADPSTAVVSPIMIRQVQHRLNALNFKAGAPDGKMGAQTVRALKSYQKSRGLTPDGKVTEEVCRRLSSDTP